MTIELSHQLGNCVGAGFILVSIGVLVYLVCKGFKLFN